MAMLMVKDVCRDMDKCQVKSSLLLWQSLDAYRTESVIDIHLGVCCIFLGNDGVGG